MIGRENWVQKLLNDQMDKLCNNPKVPNQTNQLLTQIMMIERGNPLLEPTQGSRHVEEKRPVLRRSKHVLFMKKLLKMIERGATLCKLWQNKAYNPFSATTKNMIQDVGNVELFELFETDLETQCEACLSYWSEGIVYCTCGHLLKETVANRNFIVYTWKTSWPQIWESSRKERISSGP